MGVTLYYGFYPKECNNEKVIPYLNVKNICLGINGKYLPKEFYELLKKYSEWNEKAQCWIFVDKTKLYEFCNDKSVSPSINAYISDPFTWFDEFNDEEYKEDDIFIIWKR